MACTEILKPCGVENQCCAPDRQSIVQNVPSQYSAQPQIVVHAAAAPAVAPPAPTPAPYPTTAYNPVSQLTPAPAPEPIQPPAPEPVPAPSVEPPPGPPSVEQPNEKVVNVSGGFLEAKKGFVAENMEGGWGPGGPQDLYPEVAVDKGEPEPEMPGEAVQYDSQRERLKMIVVSALVFTVIFGWCIAVRIADGGFDMPVCYEDLSYKACEVCGDGGLLLPVGGQFENSWAEYPRACMYFVGLMWCFLGVAIVCDQFMAAIEEITSKDKVVWLTVIGGAKKKFHVKVWNATVANLSLMALGSSAPEILLSCIELVGNSFFAGELGPATIVGSAAFNLLVITAVCVSAIPGGETRKIEMTTVFGVTAVLSIWAYLWLIVILQMITPDRVDVWEAIATFMMFPFLLCLSYAADRGWLDQAVARMRGKNLTSEAEQQNQRITDEQAKLTRLYGKSISFDAVKVMLDVQKSVGGKVQMTRAQHRKSVMSAMVCEAKTKGALTFGFKEKNYVVLECVGNAVVTVSVNRVPGYVVQMRYSTRDGEAKAGERYDQTDGIIKFDVNETEKDILIPIIDDNHGSAHQVSFTIELTDLRIVKAGGGLETPGTDKVRFRNSRATIIIVDDDDAGTLGFYAEELMVDQASSSVVVGVKRDNGTCGDIQVNYATSNGTALHGVDYATVEGTLEFAEGQDKASISIPILKHPDTQRRFRVTLSEPTGGARFDPNTDGGDTNAICEVILGRKDRPPGFFAKYCNAKELSLAMEEWTAQFPAALYLGGSPEDQSQATLIDYIFHAAALFWKVLFAFVPPPCLCGGWACFIIALVMIGTVTAVIGDMASMMGCCLGLNDDITAITLVALGTSLPDTFASKTAAQHDDTADNSVGNVTGSNSVNVFLGLGMPWTIGALYWSSSGPTAAWLEKEYKGSTYEALFYSTYPDGGFLVPAGSLAFSVTVFVLVATTCLLMLVVRRRLYGGELGGPSFASKRDSLIMVMLWGIYICASIIKSISDS